MKFRWRKKIREHLVELLPALILEIWKSLIGKSHIFHCEFAEKVKDI